ncbi:zinc-dependent metalloprotease [Tomitella gaofuii]|uniref:zinc-dependent metalloprotease n=1 Tax=Tomitella gaofuii TaxID=2760083 RepID=UPI0015F9B6C0|nr:zinc-dependent metalloprotease [Tomitella gaofuii]
MSDVPFGFSNSDDSGDDPERRGRDESSSGDASGQGGSGSGQGGSGQGGSPFGFGMFGLPGGQPGQGGPGGQEFDPAMLGQMLSQFGQMLSGMGGAMSSGQAGAQGPVNYELATRTAHQQIPHKGPVSSEQRKAAEDAVRLGELWLDAATTLPSGVSKTDVWTPAEWVDNTFESWKKLCDPVARQMSTMWSGALPEEAAQMAGPMMGMITQMSGMAFGAQLGQGLAQLSVEVLTSTEIGLPLGPVGTAALMPEAITAFGEGLDRPRSEVLIFLAAREAAHQRLFSHVPWLAQRLFDAVDAYARGITVDFSAIEEAARGLDPSALMDPSALEGLMQEGTFTPKDTPEQKAALERLEVLLALVEGWVATVVHDALDDRIPGADALGETLRRRRASGGPAEQTFANLVGLELRPRKLREASALWSRLTRDAGIEQRDAVWGHPDLLPDAGDLDDPAGFIDRAIGGDTSAMDDPIAEVLRIEEERSRDGGGTGGAPDGGGLNDSGPNEGDEAKPDDGDDSNDGR